MLNFPVCAETVPGAHGSSCVAPAPPFLCLSLPCHSSGCHIACLLCNLRPVPYYSSMAGSFFLLALALPHLRICPCNMKREEMMSWFILQKLWLKLLVFATPGNLIFSPQLLMTDPKEPQLVYHFIICIIWHFSRMLSCSIVFLHSSASLPSHVLLGIPRVPLNSSLAPAEWDSVEGQFREQWAVEMAWEERHGEIHSSGVCGGKLAIFSFIYCNDAPPSYLFLYF